VINTTKSLLLKLPDLRWEIISAMGLPYRTLTNSRFKFEDLPTVTPKIKAILNLRPSSPQSPDPSDFGALRRNMKSFRHVKTYKSGTIWRRDRYYTTGLAKGQPTSFEDEQNGRHHHQTLERAQWHSFMTIILRPCIIPLNFHRNLVFLVWCCFYYSPRATVNKFK